MPRTYQRIWMPFFLAMGMLYPLFLPPAIAYFPLFIPVSGRPITPAVQPLSSLLTPAPFIVRETKTNEYKSFLTNEPLLSRAGEPAQGQLPVYSQDEFTLHPVTPATPVLSEKERVRQAIEALKAGAKELEEVKETKEPPLLQPNPVSEAQREKLKQAIAILRAGAGASEKYAPEPMMVVTQATPPPAKPQSPPPPVQEKVQPPAMPVTVASQPFPPLKIRTETPPLVKLGLSGEESASAPPPAPSPRLPTVEEIAAEKEKIRIKQALETLRVGAPASEKREPAAEPLSTLRRPAPDAPRRVDNIDFGLATLTPVPGREKEPAPVVQNQKPVELKLVEIPPPLPKNEVVLAQGSEPPSLPAPPAAPAAAAGPSCPECGRTHSLGRPVTRAILNGDGRTGCSACKGCGSSGCSRCGGGSWNCSPGRHPCPPSEVHGPIGQFFRDFYECICCQDPCYDPQWIPQEHSAFFVAGARPVTQQEIRWNGSNNGVFPDRSEYIWARSDGSGRGPRAPTGVKGETRFSYNDLIISTETAKGKASILLDLPYRSMDPATYGHGSGFGDMVIGTKTLLLDCELLLVSFQFKTFMPIGNSIKGVGTGHVSLEPSLLVALKLDKDTYLQGQLSQWIPLGGDPSYMGGILHSHVSFNHVVCRINPDVPLIATLEVQTWSFQDGLYTDPILGGNQKSSGTTYASMGPGLRIFMCDKIDLGFGVALSLTRENFAREYYTTSFRVRY